MFDAIATRSSWHHRSHHPLPPISVGRPPPRTAPPRLFSAVSAPGRPVRLDAAAPVAAPSRALFGGIAAPARALEPARLTSRPSPAAVPRMFGALPAPARALRPVAVAPGEVATLRGAPFARLVRRDLAARLARRGAWTLVAGGIQAVALASLAVVTARLAVRERVPVVEVTLVRPVVRAAARAGPPGPPAPPAAPLGPRRAAPVRAAAVVRKPVSPTALLQPREVTAAPKPIDPAEPRDLLDGDGDDGGGVEGGVIGGVPGGVAGGVAGGIIGGVVGGTGDGSALMPPRPPAARTPVRFDRTMKPPLLVSAPPLEYTQRALELEVEGTMLVECVVATDGTVHACTVVNGLPYMDRAVISNLERRRYRPATLEGAPLSVRYTFAITFRLP